MIALDEAFRLDRQRTLDEWMKRIHIVGRKDHGKTTLTIDLIREFSRRGVRVGSVKHSSHAHELDTPGKDSFRQRQAGASPAAVVTADLIGVYLPRDADADFYDALAPMFASCGLVLVEGHLQCPGVKIEVWRQAAGGPCLASQHGEIAAVVSDDPLEVPCPVWPRSDVPRLAEHVLALLGQ